MTRNQFIDRIEFLVMEYMSNPEGFGPDMQIRVDPVTLAASLADSREFLDNIEDSNETVEDAAAAERPADADAMDAQVRRNPDFYPVARLIRECGDAGKCVDHEAVEAVAEVYFG